MNSKVYDVLKYIAQIVLPALAVFYVGLGEFWTMPYPTEIAGTIMLVDTFLGTILRISTTKYNKNNAIAEELSDGKGDGEDEQ